MESGVELELDKSCRLQTLVMSLLGEAGREIILFAKFQQTCEILAKIFF